jgi:phospholipid/cholesterol/gamma-HCH transport system substrate-binding protein
MANNAIETVMGAVVLVVAGGFLYFAYNNGSVKQIDGYSVKAAFTSINGIAPGSAVRVGGIKIGVVEAMTLDPQSYKAVATLRVEDGVKLPKDSSAAIQSPGLMGDKFIGIEPGGDEENLAEGDMIEYTQPSVSLEEMIGKFVFSGGGADKKAEGDAGTVKAEAPTLGDSSAHGAE